MYTIDSHKKKKERGGKQVNMLRDSKKTKPLERKAHTKVLSQLNQKLLEGNLNSDAKGEKKKKKKKNGSAQGW